MTQLFLRPSADVSTGNWTNAAGGSALFSSIDEASLDDADYIKSGINPSADACILELTNPSGTWEEPVTLRPRFKKDSAATCNFTVRLIQANATPTTWNPSDKTANITLSGGDLIGTITSDAQCGIRSVASCSTGLKYHEITVTDVAVGDLSGLLVGIANASWPFTNYLGQDANSVGWYYSGGVAINGISIGTAQGYAEGDVLCFAVDHDNERIWFRVNGGNWNNSGTANPATNTEGFDISALAAGPYFLAYYNSTADADDFALNAGASAYAFTPPAGSTNWGVGDVTIAEWEYLNIAGTFVTEEETLTTPQFEAITDPDDLRVKFEATFVPSLIFSNPRNSQYLAALEDF